MSARRRIAYRETLPSERKPFISDIVNQESRSKHNFTLEEYTDRPSEDDLKRDTIDRTRYNSFSKNKMSGSKSRVATYNSGHTEGTKHDTDQSNQIKNDTFCNLSESAEAIEEKIIKLDEEFKKIIRDASKFKVDLDLIEQKAEERRSLKNTLKYIKKNKKHAYKEFHWNPINPKVLGVKLEKQKNVKPSFLVRDKTTGDSERLKDSFGKYGTISNSLEVDDKLRIQFFDLSSAFKCLSSNKYVKLEFFEDPLPDHILKHNVVNPMLTPPTTPTIKQIQSYDDNLNYNKSKKEEHIQRNVDKYVMSNSILFDNRNQIFRTEEQVYYYFVEFGDITSIKYSDTSNIDEILDRDKKITVIFTSIESASNAVNSYHENLSVHYKDEKYCMPEKNGFKRETKNCYADSDRDSHNKPSKQETKSKFIDNDMDSDDKNFKRETKNYCSDDIRKSDKQHFTNETKNPFSDNGEFDNKFKCETKAYFGENNGDSDGKNKTNRDRRGYLPSVHDKTQVWECSSCKLVNSSSILYQCKRCQTVRPGNWFCEDCGEINLPDKLVCYQRKCARLRMGNWLCEDLKCGRTNWSNSLYCHFVNCGSIQPDSWQCRECSKINFATNFGCFFCKKPKDRGRKRKTFQEIRDFEKKAEEEKQQEALINLGMAESNDEMMLEKFQESFGFKSDLRVTESVCSTVRLTEPDFSRREVKSDFSRRITESDFSRRVTESDFSRRTKKSEFSKRTTHSAFTRKAAESDCSRDWGKEFNNLQQEQEGRKEKDKEKSRNVQERLLAVALSNTLPFNSWNGNESEEVVQLSDEETFNNPGRKKINANQIPLGKRKPKLMECSSIENAPSSKSKDYDESTAILNKLQGSSSREQALILQRYNIVEMVKKNSVTEIDLVDSETDSTTEEFSKAPTERRNNSRSYNLVNKAIVDGMVRRSRTSSTDSEIMIVE